MPKRTDIKKILIIGSGPIVIGQACEFDYSGTQACKALKEEGYKVVLVNSNPATIMTDPEFADATYIEPITAEFVEKIIAKERPDALLPTLGGQTALNVAIQLHERGVLDRYGVEMIGANPTAIKKAEDRELFKEAMQRIGLDLPRSGFARSMEEAWKVVKEIGFPVIIRPSFTLGGTGGGVAYNVEEFEEIANRGLEYSMINEILIEESVEGWKEFELEVMRDKNDNVVIICSIENLDPMGIHTGDSITVAPAQTLTDKEYQRMRTAAIKVIREIGVDTGGSNIQFAVNPKDGRMVVIEMNPRVSRSSALASKATGFPIARIAAKLAVGYTLDEIPNDITRETPASFEPVLDYCVVKFPRWAFEKFPGSEPVLTTSMKSVGEVMAIGRTFKEALQKAIRSLEIGRFGLLDDGSPMARKIKAMDVEELRIAMSRPTPERIFQIAEAINKGVSVEEIYEITSIDPWFLDNIRQIVEFDQRLSNMSFLEVDLETLRQAKEMGFSDRYLAYKWGIKETELRDKRKALEVRPTYKLVDTCSAEFEAYTPYFYSCYDREDESRVKDVKKVVILGGGPNRIGQGIEFDYCCVHASFALKEMGYQSIMVNSNPETVSTDYDTSDKLFFEPLTFEDVLNIVEMERPYGVIVQLGGQTPLNISVPLRDAGVKILGTSAEAIDRAEDRDKFKALLEKLGLKQPPNGIAVDVEEAKEIARSIGYPVLLRPSYVLGGRAMEIVYDEASLEKYMVSAVDVSERRPVLIDKFLEDAIEVDVDLISDGETAVIGGILEHIEYAGVHSGDSAMVLPPHSLDEDILEEIRRATYALAEELHIVGLMNVQYAIKDGQVYVLEVNPRASRTIPFISKAIGVPLAKLATKVMLGEKLKDLGFTEERWPKGYYAVKESVFPFNRFPGVDIILSPEMRSTGEVMGIDKDVGTAYLKSQIAAGQNLPTEGLVFVSVRDADKPGVVGVVKALLEMGFEVISTKGTANYLAGKGLKVRMVPRLAEGRPNTLDYIKNGELKLIINTPSGRIPRKDEVKIRSTAILHGVPCITTIAGAYASIEAIRRLKEGNLEVRSIQDYYNLKTR